MGSYDRAESCELVGSFLLAELQKKLGNNVGLYRDDGLAVSNKSPKQTETIKKKITTIFKRHDLRITIEVNKKIVNFLDTTLNLSNGAVQPLYEG